MAASSLPLLPIDEPARLKATSAASWGAILAGAAVAVAMSLVLVLLGAGLGFASVSPWADHGISATTLSVAGTIWLVVTQWLSAAAGGYIAGRLRARWLATHTYEVFFRDTAHGLVTWSVATLFMAALLGSGASHTVSGGARMVGAAGGAVAQEAAQMASADTARGKSDVSGPQQDYAFDKLLRKGSLGASPTGGGAEDYGHARAEVAHIATASALTGEVKPEDRAYLIGLTASETGVPTEEAEHRVDALLQSLAEAKAQAQAAADKARKAAALASLYAALALVIGAFIASVAGAIGGRLRDEHL